MKFQNCILKKFELTHSQMEGRTDKPKAICPFNGHNNTNDSQKKKRLGTVSKSILLMGLNQFHGANLAYNYIRFVHESKCNVKHFLCPKPQV